MVTGYWFARSGFVVHGDQGKIFPAERIETWHIATVTGHVPSANKRDEYWIAQRDDVDSVTRVDDGTKWRWPTN